MSDTFSIKFTVSTQSDQVKFKQAYAQLYALVRKLVTSKDKHIQSYIADPLGSDETWVWLDEDNDLRFMAERPVSICNTDAEGKLPKKIHYDFGKASPMPVEFMGTVMSIMVYYFPKAEISRDAVDYIDEFSQGVYLANIVNSKVINPLLNKNMSVTPKIRNDINRILQLLKNNIEAIKVENLQENIRPLKSSDTQMVTSKKRKESNSSDEETEEVKYSSIAIKKAILSNGGVMQLRGNGQEGCSETRLKFFKKTSHSDNQENNINPNISFTSENKY